MEIKVILGVIIILFLIIIDSVWKNDLLRFCAYTPIKTMVYSAMLSLLLWGISTSFVNLEEWNQLFQPKGMEMVLYPLIINAYCSLCSFSIFLNAIKAIRYNWFFSMLTFFLLPFFVVLYFVFIPYWSIDAEITRKTVFLPLFYSLGFFMPQIYFYIKFRKRLA